MRRRARRVGRRFGLRGGRRSRFGDKGRRLVVRCGSWRGCGSRRRGGGKKGVRREEWIRACFGGEFGRVGVWNELVMGMVVICEMGDEEEAVGQMVGRKLVGNRG